MGSRSWCQCSASIDFMTRRRSSSLPGHHTVVGPKHIHLLLLSCLSLSLSLLLSHTDVSGVLLGGAWSLRSFVSIVDARLSCVRDLANVFCDRRHFWNSYKTSRLRVCVAYMAIVAARLLLLLLGEEAGWA